MSIIKQEGVPNIPPNGNLDAILTNLNLRAHS
jgi:hypothetical protein